MDGEQNYHSQVDKMGTYRLLNLNALVSITAGVIIAAQMGLNLSFYT